MHKHIRSFKQNPTQKFAKTASILKNPKIFQKPKNLDLYESKAWKRVKQDLTSEGKNNLDRKSLG